MNIVGKSIGILAVCSSVYARLDLHLTTMDDLPLEQGAIGEPFFIHIRDTEPAGSIQQPHVAGIDSLVQQGTTFAMHTINTVSTVVYKFKVRADAVGTYTIGPASVNRSGKLELSNSVEFTVGDSMVVDKKHQKKPTVFVVLEVDKDRVVVGEKVVCTLTVYSSDQIQTRVQTIKEPNELKEIGHTIHDPEALEQGTKIMHGKTYMYGQWRWEVYPKKSGIHTIPAFSVDYTLLTSGNSFFSFMEWWEDKRMYSNGLQIQVDTLPSYHQSVNGVGTFTSFTAELDSTVSPVGSAMVLRLTLVGDGNWGVLDEPCLKGLDESIKAYYSSSVLDQTAGEGSSKKTFEYILQPIKEGDLIIQPQLFTYFDTKDRTYKQLKTAPLYLTITPAVHKNSYTQCSPEIERPKRDISPLRTLGSSRVPLYLPGWIFLLLLVLPLMVLICEHIVFPMCRRIVNWYTVKSIQGRAAQQARNHIYQAHLKKEYEALYAIFMRYFAQLSNTLSVQSTSEQITRLLGVCTLEHRAQWDAFFESLVTLRFKGSANEKEEIFEQAHYWIRLFEKYRIGRNPSTMFSWFSFS